MLPFHRSPSHKIILAPHSRFITLLLICNTFNNIDKYANATNTIADETSNHINNVDPSDLDTIIISTASNRLSMSES